MSVSPSVAPLLSTTPAASPSGPAGTSLFSDASITAVVSPADDNSSLAAALIAVAVSLAVVALLLCVVLAYAYVRYKKRRAKKRAQKQHVGPSPEASPFSGSPWHSDGASIGKPSPYTLPTTNCASGGSAVARKRSLDGLLAVVPLASQGPADPNTTPCTRPRSSSAASVQAIDEDQILTAERRAGINPVVDLVNTRGSSLLASNLSISPKGRSNSVMSTEEIQERSDTFRKQQDWLTSMMMEADLASEASSRSSSAQASPRASPRSSGAGSALPPTLPSFSRELSLSNARGKLSFAAGANKSPADTSEPDWLHSAGNTAAEQLWAHESFGAGSPHLQVHVNQAVAIRSESRERARTLEDAAQLGLGGAMGTVVEAEAGPERERYSIDAY